MKKLMSAMLGVFVCFGITSAQTGKKATAREKKELFQLILKDKAVSELLADYNGGKNKLAESLKVERKDLNKDGKPEFIATLENEFMCGAHANCPSWVYRKEAGDYRLLLNTFGQQLGVQKTSTNKFFDLRSDGADSAFETSFAIYKFDGTKYNAVDCFTVTHDPKLKSKTARIKCQELGD